MNPTQPAAPKAGLFASVAHTAAVISSALVAFLGAQIIGPFFIAIIALVFFNATEKNVADKLESNAYLRFLTILVVEVLTVYIVYWLLKRRKQTFAHIGMPKKPTLQDLGRGIFMYGTYFVIYLGVLMVVTSTKIINTNQEQQLGFGNPTGAALVATFAALVVLPPIAEEILFRGYIFFGLKQKLKPLYAGIITSLLFGIAHLEFGTGSPLNWAAAIDTATLSAVLVYSAQKYKSIWPGMATHALKNMVAFVLLFVIK